MYKIEISDSAIEDLVDIFEYTFINFGEKQWQKYNSIIDENINSLTINPFIGHGRNDIPVNCLAWLVGDHFLIYRVEGSIVYLLRVLNQRMDFLLQF
ncbi:MAG: type II toxin-antitoxin system RelE/ParE family toxin [Bacteroidota bacterium]